MRNVDGTFRVCLSLLGQPKFNDPPSVRQQFPYTGESSITRVISIRGRSGAVLGLIPAAGEGPSHILHCLQSALPERGLQQVEHIAVDNPSGKLFQELKGTLCKLTSVSLDPTHACMHYEQALGKHRSAGSGTLRESLWPSFVDETLISRPTYGGPCLRATTVQESLAKSKNFAKKLNQGRCQHEKHNRC